jgi:hypothetical protein
MLKKLWRNWNPVSCEKSATGVEKAGIRRIPTGITNLAQEINILSGPYSALVSLPKLADAGYTTVLTKMVRQSTMTTLQPSQ